MLLFERFYITQNQNKIKFGYLLESKFQSDNRVCIYFVNNLLDSRPNRNICKYFNYASSVRKRSFKKNGHIFHNAVVNDILNNLVEKIYLPFIKICIIKIFRKSGFRSAHIKSDNFAHKFTERLFAVICFVLLISPYFTPEYFFKLFKVNGSERLVGFKLGDN